MRQPDPWRIGSLMGVGLVMLIAPGYAQDFPTKAVRLLTPSVGSGGDVMSRNLGPLLSQRLGQAVIIENRAGSVIPAEMCAKASPDGYTILMGQFSSHASAPAIYKSLPYDPVKDFAHVTLVAKSPSLLVSHPSLRASTLADVIDYAKKRPGELKYAAQSGGSNGRLTMVLFSRAAGIDMMYVPYKGPAFSMAAILAGETELSFLTTAAVSAHVKAGKLKAYGITSARRFSLMPDIPTIAESGLPGFESSTWWAMFAPPRTPPAIIGMLNREIVEILQSPSFKKGLLVQGAEAAPTTPAELEAFVKSEILKWGQAIKLAGIKPE